VSTSKYTNTARAVADYDRAWQAAEAAETTQDMNEGIAGVDAAEQKVRECWANEARLYADPVTAMNVRDLGLPACSADWTFLREVVLKISTPGGLA